ncbi:hypothetical protein LX32DRAFT_258371 [Colletotrichum zoysiae]|uniref:Uncharacterized protein n=1 Tax=Colletotrichum zoysiae TaxID=1216348 RepID=A0AAD9H501_9PEZI|nr:hypothetical protein LX32DRAFT_258371 [Colletotrichum zoysiae]
MAPLHELSVMSAGAKEVFRCLMPRCTSKPFATKANLKRHNKAKHGSKYQTPCGKLLRAHASDNQRHLKTCHKCKCKCLEGPEQAPPLGAASVPVPPLVSPNLVISPELQHDDSWYRYFDAGYWRAAGDGIPDGAPQEQASRLSFDPCFNTGCEQHQFPVHGTASEETVPEWSESSTGYSSTGGFSRDRSLGLSEDLESASSTTNHHQHLKEPVKAAGFGCDCRHPAGTAGGGVANNHVAGWEFKATSCNRGCMPTLVRIYKPRIRSPLLSCQLFVSSL